MIRTRLGIGDGLRGGVEHNGHFARRKIEILEQTDAPFLLRKLFFLGDARRKRRNVVGESIGQLLPFVVREFRTVKRVAFFLVEKVHNLAVFQCIGLVVGSHLLQLPLVVLDSRVELRDFHAQVLLQPFVFEMGIFDGRQGGFQAVEVGLRILIVGCQTVDFCDFCPLQTPVFRVARGNDQQGCDEDADDEIFSVLGFPRLLLCHALVVAVVVHRRDLMHLLLIHVQIGRIVGGSIEFGILGNGVRPVFRIIKRHKPVITSLFLACRDGFPEVIQRRIYLPRRHQIAPLVVAVEHFSGHGVLARIVPSRLLFKNFHIPLGFGILAAIEQDADTAEDGLCRLILVAVFQVELASLLFDDEDAVGFVFQMIGSRTQVEGDECRQRVFSLPRDVLGLLQCLHLVVG